MTFRTFPNIFPRIWPRKFEEPGSANIPSFSSVLIGTYGASEVWPLVDIASGTTIIAKVSSARNSTLTGWDLQNMAGPVPGTLAPYSDGVNDRGDGFSASLASIFNGGIGSAIMFGKVDSWTSANVRRMFYFFADANNSYVIHQAGGSNLLTFSARVAGTAKNINHNPNDTGWFSAGMSWMDGANGNAIKFYYNGAQVGATQTGVGNFLGPLTGFGIGSQYSGALEIWKGHLAYMAAKFGAIWSDADFAAIHAAAATTGAE